MSDAGGFSWRRLRALCIKETRQILRDPSSGLIAFVIPLILLFIFGYGINLDSSKLRLGIVIEQPSREGLELLHSFTGSPYVAATVSQQREALLPLLQAGSLRGLLVIPSDFAARMARPGDQAVLQIITDGSEPNTASFIQGYTRQIWQLWQQQHARDQGREQRQLIELELRYWFNSAVISRHFIIPGAISIIMTVIGAILTSLVMAREWERGTMEALLSTPISRTELLLSKLLPYYLLGIGAMALCMLVALVALQVPYRGSWLLLWLVSSLYLACTLGIGLLISTLTRNQFNAAMVALNVAFLPAVMLSGYIFQISSMPTVVRAISQFIPARYFVSALQTLFLAGNIVSVLITNLLFLSASALIFLGFTALKTQRRLD
ncbi:ABC transporter permease [Serratia microhaemolytica]|uniref:ABC transporter permease n=1 Tax=Serratia microhaemolytica TaxID=2675110 RepID=UPI000FDD8704|nr:ABC transporter permease [Serratia microhaemolytica]